jgi:hypothetical protein
VLREASVEPTTERRIRALLSPQVKRLAAEIFLSLIFSDANAAIVLLNTEWVVQLQSLLSDPGCNHMKREVQGIFLKLSLKRQNLDAESIHPSHPSDGGYSKTTKSVATLAAKSSGGATADGDVAGFAAKSSTQSPTQQLRTGTISKKLMISYCWAQQAAVKELYQCLVDHGFDVWLDIHEMAKDSKDCSVLGAMSTAIDEADAVLVAVSREYRDSANCRLEAEYAHVKKKRVVFMMMQEDFTTPSGWLGMMIGAKLWHNFFDFTEPMTAKVEHLVESL